MPSSMEKWPLVTDLLPTISVVIPVKDEENYISFCLESLLRQNYPVDLYEIIVVDNGSEDRTREIVRNHCGKANIKLVNYDGHTIAGVRNHGAQIACGSILAFIDGDCVADTEWLAKGTELLRSNQSVGCIGFVSADPDETSSWVEKAWSYINSRARYTGTVPKDWLSSFNLIMWKSVFQEVGGFNEGLTTCEDADLGYRIGRMYTLLISDRVKVRHLGESKTIGEFIDREVWRGVGNLASYVSAVNRKGFVSAFLPSTYVTLHVAFVLSILSIAGAASFVRLSCVTSTVMMIIAVPVAMTIKKARSLPGVAMFVRMCLLCYLYLMARGIAVFHICSKRKRRTRRITDSF